MIAYWKAVGGRLGEAAYDVLFVALLSLAPLLLGRLAVMINQNSSADEYWSFLHNGQLAFFSMGSLATLQLLCLRSKLPSLATMIIGFLSISCMLFLVALVVIDPTLQRGQAFVGRSALVLYGGVLLTRVIADALKAVGAGDALQAGNTITSRVRSELSKRMGEPEL